MFRALRRWQASLAGRLVVLLLGALAAAQAVLFLALRTQQDLIVADMAHSQALAKTVTLARLLTTFPPQDAERLEAAFNSRMTCVNVANQPTPARAMTTPERQLAALVAKLLHGVAAGTPQVEIDASPGKSQPCGPDARAFAPGGAGADLKPFAAVTMIVPLDDQREITVKTAIEKPETFSRVSAVSFFLSALTVGGVAIVVARLQTRSLRALAEASERLGRGEMVAPLSTGGPPEVAAAARAFNTMQERLSEYFSDRLRLLGGIGHDLRTPLTTLRLKAEFIDDEAVRDDIVATIDEMTGITEATLAFIRAEATTEASQKVDLPDLVDDVAKEFLLADERVAVAPSPAFAFVCRPVALRRALRNLIENAVRYGGGAWVSVARDTAGVTIAVEDDGPGVPEHLIEEAFKPFVRLETSRNIETGGLGLGLCIARNLVKAHGGALTLANRPQGGAIASIRLPMSA
jgi:signal transduction histidine kinase